jgi:hypothetical protein
MNKFQTLIKIKQLLEKVSVKFTRGELVDGTQIEWEGELAVGSAIFVVSEEGNAPAPDAKHETEEAYVTTENGIVTSIEPKEAEAEAPAAEEAPVEEVEAEIAFPEFQAKLDEYAERIAVLEVAYEASEIRFAELAAKLDALTGSVDESFSKIQKLSNQAPAPARVDVRNIFNKTENKSRAMQILGSK